MARDGDICAAGDAEDDGVILFEREGEGERESAFVKNKGKLFSIFSLLTLFFFVFISKVTSVVHRVFEKQSSVKEARRYKILIVVMLKDQE